MIKKSAITDLKVVVDNTHERMKLSVDNGYVMNLRVGCSRVKLTLINVKINTEVFSKGIEKGRVKTTEGYQILNRVCCWRLLV